MGEGPNRAATRGAGSSRRSSRASAGSARRIDLYQVHRPDPGTDIDETLGALSDLVHAGKIRYLGSSTFPAHTIVEAQWTAERRPGAVRVRAAALLDPRPRDRARRAAGLRGYGMGVIPWSPLAGGWLTGRSGRARSATRRRAGPHPQRYDLWLPENQRKLEAVEELALLAQEAGLTLIHIAIAFVLPIPAVTAPIIGPRTMEHLESQLSAAASTLRERARPDRRARHAPREPEPGRFRMDAALARGCGAPAALGPFPRRGLRG